MNKGLLKSWNDEKGFGFIKSTTQQHDTFIHISSLKHMSRKPKVGDIIYFEVATEPKRTKWGQILTSDIKSFSKKWQTKVNAQWQLYCLVHNIEKLQKRLH